MINGRAPLDFPMVATPSSIAKKVINEKTADISDAASPVRFIFTFPG
jgi:hypothetical protein